jgi:iron complex transport system permease protein
MQAVMRNPLAEPYLLGVSSGGGLGAALAIATGLSFHASGAVPVAAFVAALITLGFVHLLASAKGPPNTYDLLLCGIAVSALCSSLLMLLVSLSTSHRLQGILWWMLGNMQNADPRILLPAAAAIVASLAAACLLSRDLNALTLGRDMAHHLGINTRLAVTLALVIATFSAAAAVGLAGLIGFVGLVAPHAMRKITGPDHRVLLPASALAGGAFLTLCDLLSRTCVYPREIPVGVITALVGAPCFLFILRRRKP